jgi:hypothetical protein
MTATTKGAIYRATAMLALAIVLACEIAWAQLPAPNPLVVPPLPPGPPAQLPAPVTTAIAPIPIAVPSLPAAYSTPGARMFNCSCSGPRQPTRWMGTVTASSYLAASNSASGACSSYNQGRPPTNGTAGGIGAANFFASLPGAQQNADAARSYGFPGVAQVQTSGTTGGVQGAGAANSYGSPSSGVNASSALFCSNCVCD